MIKKDVRGKFMRISTKGRYALRVMVDLAMNSKEEPIKMKEIALRQNLSEKYWLECQN